MRVYRVLWGAKTEREVCRISLVTRMLDLRLTIRENEGHIGLPRI